MLPVARKVYYYSTVVVKPYVMYIREPGLERQNDA